MGVPNPNWTSNCWPRKAHQQEWPPFNSPQPTGSGSNCLREGVQTTQFLESRVCTNDDSAHVSALGGLAGPGPGALYIRERTPPRVSSDGADKTRPNPPKQGGRENPLAGAAMESTFIMIKPDGVQRGLVSRPTFSLFVSVDWIRFGGLRALAPPIWY